ncbi:hypothetical protein ABZP36_020290 [Zizania latifolia]
MSVWDRLFAANSDVSWFRLNDGGGSFPSTLVAVELSPSSLPSSTAYDGPPACTSHDPKEIVDRDTGRTGAPRYQMLPLETDLNTLPMIPNLLEKVFPMDAKSTEEMATSSDNWSTKSGGSDAEPEVSRRGWGRPYMRRELEEATGGFAAENMLGEGAYGKQ